MFTLFSEEFFSLIEKLNIERRELTNLVENEIDVAVGQLVALLHQGNLTRISMAKNFIWESLDGNRHYILRNNIENSTYLSSELREQLLESFFNHH